jgi:hypothetical protein
MLKKKDIMLSCTITLVLLGIGLGIGIRKFSSNAMVINTEAIIEKIQKNEFGKLKSKGTDDLDGKKNVVILEDNKYEYKVDPEDGNIVSFGIKNDMIDKYLKTQGDNKLGKDDAILEAKQLLSKYFTDKSQKMDMVKYDTKKDDAHNVHIISFEGTASNGVKTGDYVYMWINQNKELVLYATYKGNSSIAQNSTAYISEEVAAKNAWNYIINNFELDKNTKIPDVKPTLKVWQDKLSYSVNFIDAVDTSIGKKSFYIIVDAQTGSILFSDSTK